LSCTSASRSSASSSMNNFTNVGCMMFFLLHLVGLGPLLSVPWPEPFRTAGTSCWASGSQGSRAR
jgi:hypothetical protein